VRGNGSEGIPVGNADTYSLLVEDLEHIAEAASKEVLPDKACDERVDGVVSGCDNGGRVVVRHFQVRCS
jgi:hypothetical protein